MMDRRRFLSGIAAATSGIAATAGGIAAAMRGSLRPVAPAAAGVQTPDQPNPQSTGSSPTAEASPQVPTPPYAVVLGSVQDGGLPQAGCYTDRCNRARENPRYVTSLAIVAPARGGGPDARRFYLVDATPDLRVQMDLIPDPAFRHRAQTRRPFDGIFLTHAHMGHYLGLAYLGRESLAISRTPVYCSPEMRRFLTNNGPWSLLVDEGRIHFPEIPMDQWHNVDNSMLVRMMPVPHRPEFSDTVAFMFQGIRRTLLYLPDIDAWNKWDQRIEEVVRGVDVALLDGAFFRPDEVPGRAIEDIPHPMIPDTMTRLQPAVRAGKRIVFTHLNNTNPVLDEGSPEARRVLDAGFELAQEGTVYPL